MKGVFFIKSYLEKIIKSKNNGLYICQLPTGYGKSYSIAEEIASLVKNNEKRKIIYLTTLTKNIPSNAISGFFKDNQELFSKSILVLKSNFDEVQEKLLDLEIPNEFCSDTYVELINLLKRHKHLETKKIADHTYIDDLKVRIEKAEKKFRKEIQNRLFKEFNTKEKRLNAIKVNSKFKWIGELYPAVFTDSHQVLLMTVSKFLNKNSTIIEKSYDFITSDILNNAIIFIDEFDASKAYIQNHIIEKALAFKSEYISLFCQIHRGLNTNSENNATDRFIPTSLPAILIECSDYSKDNKKSRLRKLIEKGNALYNSYMLYLSYKTADENIDHQQNFLFNDGSFHTILDGNNQYIRTSKNDATNQVEIHFETKREFYKNRSDSDIVIYSMLREIHAYLNSFRILIYDWAEEYRNKIRLRSNITTDTMQLNTAVNTILSALSLTEEQKELLLAEKCNSKIKSEKKILVEQDFYMSGMEIFEFEDSYEHNENTNLQFIKIYDTPEKIVKYVAEKATVFAVSATADINTVLGNYNLSYLNSKLGHSYHPMDHNLQKRIHSEMINYWKPYKDGTVKVHTKVLKSINNTGHRTNSFVNNMELADIAENLIKCYTDNDYAVDRYFKIFEAMCSFWRYDDIKAFLCLNMGLPKDNSPDFDLGLLKRLLSIAAEDLGKKCNDNTIFVLGGHNFDEEKEKLLSELSYGKKRFVMSSYSTIGAGQNLQYEILDKSELIELVPYIGDNDKRHFSKDFDAIYLGDVTHLIVNTYKHITKENMITMLFNVEELYYNGEINYQKKDEMIKLAFRSYIGKNNNDNTMYNLQSVRLKATQLIIQAVGRMCRTFLKKPDIYIFIDEKILNKLDVNEMKKRILPPEMEAIVQLCSQYGTVYTEDEKQVLNIAERIATNGMWRIRRTLSKNWDEGSMNAWEELRRVVLTYPTATSKQYTENELIRELYITSGVPQNKYLYSQYSDFSDVTIDFTNDEISFRNSSRAKIKGETDEVGVWKMSADESGLKTILKYDGMKNYFVQQGFAMDFKESMYIMSPVLFHNIYKGALGEVAGVFILAQERGIELNTITDPNKFEFFDFQMKQDVYVDFKNWKFTYLQEREKVRKEILRKLDAIGGKRVYIINVVDSKEFAYSESYDGRIIEIPGLIDDDGKVITTALDYIKKEDYE